MARFRQNRMGDLAQRTDRWLSLPHLWLITGLPHLSVAFGAYFGRRSRLPLHLGGTPWKGVAITQHWAQQPVKKSPPPAWVKALRCVPSERPAQLDRSAANRGEGSRRPCTGHKAAATVLSGAL